MVKPDDPPSEVTCKLFTDSAVLYSAELHSNKITKMFKKKVHHLNFITVVQRHGTIIKTCDRAKSYFEHLKKVIKAEYAHRHLYTHTQSQVKQQVISGQHAFRVWWANRSLFCIKVQITGHINKWLLPWSKNSAQSKHQYQISSHWHIHVHNQMFNDVTVKRVCLKRQVIASFNNSIQVYYPLCSW